MRNKFLAAFLTLCMTSVMFPASLFAGENVPVADDAAGENVIEEGYGPATGEPGAMDREEVYFSDNQTVSVMSGEEWTGSEERAAKEAENITAQQEVLSGGDTEGKELVQLPTPTDLTWGIRTGYDYYNNTLTTKNIPGWIEWKLDDTINTDSETCSFTLYKKGETEPSAPIYRYTSVSYSNINGMRIYHSTSLLTNPESLESGKYYFTVQWIGDGEEYSDSEIALSEIWEYQKPEARLGISITKTEWEWPNYKWEYIGDISDASCFQWEIGFSETEESQVSPIAISGSYDFPNLDGTGAMIDDIIQRHGKGCYYFRIRALSRDITKYQHGAWSDWSPAYNLTEVTNGVSDSLDQILNDPASSDPAQIRQQIKNIDRTDLRSAMLADPTILNQIQQLEEMITDKDGIGVEINVEDPQIQENFPENKVQIHGAKLNNPKADAAKITLQIDRPKKEDLVIPSRYKNTLAIKFSMDIDGLEETADRTLDIPVRITLPIPENINPKRLSILHYQSDDTHTAYESPSSIHTYQEEDGQWYVSFILDHFSDFVMTEIASAVVTFDANGGTCSTATLSVNDADTLSEIPVPTRSGYTFDGWYTQDGVKVDATTIFKEDTTVTAKWTQTTVNPPIVNPPVDPTVPVTTPTVTPSVTPGTDVTPTPSENITPTPCGNVTPSPSVPATPSLTPAPTETIKPDITPEPRPKAVQILKSRYDPKGKRLKKKVGSSLTQVITGAKTTVTFESSDPKVAKVGKTSGTIDLIGVGKVVITAKAAGSSEYKAAQKQLTIYVIPKTAGIKSIRSDRKGQVTLKSNNTAKGNDGYQIQYKHNGKTKKVTLKSKKSITKTFKNLKSGKNFKARIRAYKKADGKTYYGKYSKWKTVKKVR
ncbi:MAG: hypothetical protein HFH55_10765 [Lachnospiraceae bacterium]|nr:hypothetical protein [Lachnospiraceae bacterium]